MNKFNKRELQKFAYDELVKQIQDKNTSAAVRVQALTQIIKLSETMPEGVSDKLEEFLKDE